MFHRSFLFSALLSTCFIPALHAAEPGPSGQILLTVAGSVNQPDRSAPNPDVGSMFNTLGIEYDQAMSFDSAALAAFEQVDIETALFDGAVSGVFRGPRLRAVLEHVGQAESDVTPTGLDGFEFEIPAEMIATYDPILATHFDQRPLSIGERGPLMIIFPPVEDPALAEEISEYQAWGTFFIRVD